MFEHFPFWNRAALLAGLMLVGAAVDRWRHGEAANRHKEYGFIWLTGIIGCLAGGINDLITSSISPDYFILGKGLAGGEGFRLRAVLFGVQEGLSAGVIAGAICVYVARGGSKRPPVEFNFLFRLLGRPICCAAAGALLVPVLAGHYDPAGLALKMSETEQAQTIVPAFLRVWWIHTGLYAGLLAGVLWMVAAIMVKRRRSKESEPVR